MTTRPLPDHNTRARYLRGCRCTPCCTANYHYMSQLRLDSHRGERRRVPAGPSRDRATTLHTAGWSMHDIATAADCSRRTVSALIAGTTTNIRRDIANRILTIPADAPLPRPPRDVDATGTIRRIRALATIGWPLSRIGPAIGLHREQTTRIARGEYASVRAATADRTARVYRAWCTRPGPSTRARTHAAQCGWHGPLAWDDIDNPDARPEADTNAAASQRRSPYTAAEIAHLDSLGVSAHEIARQVDRSVGYVQDILNASRSQYGEAA